MKGLVIKKDTFELGKEFLIYSNREELILACLGNKNQLNIY